MKAYDKSLVPKGSKRDIKRTIMTAGESSHPVGVKVKDQAKMMPDRGSPMKLEEEYVRLFMVPDAPQQAFYSDDYNLEQPSALKYVPSTAEPNAEV